MQPENEPESVKLGEAWAEELIARHSVMQTPKESRLTTEQILAEMREDRF